jgi:pimeloyl-ACP methyl ester carboxylesterase
VSDSASIAQVRSLRLDDGRELCVREWPAAGEETLVLLHGLLDSSEGWEELCGAVGGRRIAFDLPGFGYSDPPRRGSLAGYARDIAEGLEALELGRFTLVGHSLGGAVAACLAELMPKRIEALILLAPAGFGHIHLAEALSLPGVRNLLEAALPVLLSNRLALSAGYMAMVSNGRTPDDGLVERVTSRGGALADGVREATRAVVDASRSPDAFHRRSLRYGGPVYGVWGDGDRLVPSAHARGLRTACGHAQVEIWPGMGHHATRERFERLVALVERATAAGRPAVPTGARRRAA